MDQINKSKKTRVRSLKQIPLYNKNKISKRKSEL